MSELENASRHSGHLDKDEGDEMKERREGTYERIVGIYAPFSRAATIVQISVPTMIIPGALLCLYSSLCGTHNASNPMF